MGVVRGKQLRTLWYPFEWNGTALTALPDFCKTNIHVYHIVCQLLLVGFQSFLQLTQIWIEQWLLQHFICLKLVYYWKHWNWTLCQLCLHPSQLNALIVLTEGLKVNTIILVYRSWGKPMRKSQGGFLLRLSPHTVAVLHWSIQNYTGHLRSCSVTTDLLGGNMV